MQAARRTANAVFQALTADAQPSWPVDALLPAPAGKTPCVIVTTGAMNPLHCGHVAMLDRAAEKLESLGDLAVVGGFVSPSHDLYVGPKMKAAGASKLFAAAHHRVALCRAVLEDHPRWRCATWEARVEGRWPDFPEVCSELERHLAPRYPGLQVFYVCNRAQRLTP